MDEVGENNLPSAAYYTYVNHWSTDIEFLNFNLFRKFDQLKKSKKSWLLENAKTRMMSYVELLYSDVWSSWFAENHSQTSEEYLDGKRIIWTKFVPKIDTTPGIVCLGWMHLLKFLNWVMFLKESVSKTCGYKTNYWDTFKESYIAWEGYIEDSWPLLLHTRITMPPQVPSCLSELTYATMNGSIEGNIRPMCNQTSPILPPEKGAGGLNRLVGSAAYFSQSI